MNDGRRYTFITDGPNGPQENVVILSHEDGALRIKLESATVLADGTPCRPCSAQEFVDHLNSLPSN